MPGNLARQRHEARQTVDELRRHLGLFSYQQDGQTAESGPQGGLSTQLGVRPGGIVELLMEREGAGAVTLALQIMVQSSGGRGVWAIVDPARECYVAALSGWGIQPARTLVLRPGSLQETCWAIEQCLRCPGVRRRHWHGSISGSPRGFIVAGNWRQRWGEGLACFFGRSGRGGNPSGPIHGCW